MQRERRTKFAIMTIVAIIAGIILGIIMIEVFREDEEATSRVFENAGSAIILRADGTFVALLPHNIRLAGDFEETESPVGTDVLFMFTHNGVDRTDIGTITGNILTAPDAWDVACGHGHGLIYTLR